MAQIEPLYPNFSRARRKTVKQKRELRVSLLYLLGKLNGQLDVIEKQHREELVLDGFYHKRRNIIRQVLARQGQMHQTDRAGS